MDRTGVELCGKCCKETTVCCTLYTDLMTEANLTFTKICVSKVHGGGSSTENFDLVMSNGSCLVALISKSGIHGDP